MNYLSAHEEEKQKHEISLINALKEAIAALSNGDAVDIEKLREIEDARHSASLLSTDYQCATCPKKLHPAMDEYAVLHVALIETALPYGEAAQRAATRTPLMPFTGNNARLVICKYCFDKYNFSGYIGIK